VAKKVKRKFQFNSAFFVRALIFFLIFTASINLLSRQSPRPKDQPSILGSQASDLLDQIDYQQIINNIYQKIPPKSREKLENINQLPLYLTIEQKIQPILSQLQDFPQKQIKDLKKEIINRLYQDIMKSLEEN